MEEGKEKSITLNTERSIKTIETKRMVLHWVLAA